MTSMMLVQDTLSAQAVDTLVVVQRAAADSVYLEILQKTNQQLGFWATSSGAAVTVLTAFVAILAIAVAFTLYRQGRDYQLQLDRRLAQYDDLIQASITAMQGQADEMLEELKERAETAEGDELAKVQAKIEELKERRAGLQVGNATMQVKGWPATIGTSARTRPGPIGPYRTEVCSNCGSSYRVRRGVDEHECPHCHEKKPPEIDS